MLIRLRLTQGESLTSERYKNSEVELIIEALYLRGRTNLSKLSNSLMHARALVQSVENILNNLHLQMLDLLLT